MTHETNIFSVHTLAEISSRRGLGAAVSPPKLAREGSGTSEQGNYVEPFWITDADWHANAVKGRENRRPWLATPRPGEQPDIMIGEPGESSPAIPEGSFSGYIQEHPSGEDAQFGHYHDPHGPIEQIMPLVEHLYWQRFRNEVTPEKTAAERLFENRGLGGDFNPDEPMDANGRYIRAGAAMVKLEQGVPVASSACDVLKVIRGGIWIRWISTNKTELIPDYLGKEFMVTSFGGVGRGVPNVVGASPATLDPTTIAPPRYDLSDLTFPDEWSQAQPSSWVGSISSPPESSPEGSWADAQGYLLHEVYQHEEIAKYEDAYWFEIKDALKRAQPDAPFNLKLPNGVVWSIEQVKTRLGAAHDEQPKVVEQTPEKWPAIPQEDAVMRHPFVFMPEHNTIYLGIPDSNHQDITDSFGLDRFDAPQRCQGQINIAPASWGRRPQLNWMTQRALGEPECNAVHSLLSQYYPGLEPDPWYPQHPSVVPEGDKDWSRVSRVATEGGSEDNSAGGSWGPQKTFDMSMTPQQGENDLLHTNEPVNTSNVMYHVSAPESRGSIESRGLIPGYDHGEDTQKSYGTGFSLVGPAVFLSPTLEEANAIKQAWRRDADTWLVNTDDIELQADPSNPEHGFYTTHPIGPDKLTLMGSESHAASVSEYTSNVYSMGLNGQLPEGLSFRIVDFDPYEPGDEPDSKPVGWINDDQSESVSPGVEAILNGKVIGYLSHSFGKIQMIQVEPEYRRMGVATAMKNFLEQHIRQPLEHDWDNIDPDGEAWAQKVGDYTPDVNFEPEKECPDCGADTTGRNRCPDCGFQTTGVRWILDSDGQVLMDAVQLHGDLYPDDASMFAHAPRMVAQGEIESDGTITYSPVNANNDDVNEMASIVARKAQEMGLNINGQVTYSIYRGGRWERGNLKLGSKTAIVLPPTTSPAAIIQQTPASYQQGAPVPTGWNLKVDNTPGPTKAVAPAFINGTTYSYEQTQWDVQSATISLNKSQLKSGHVAVWLGASDPQVTGWIQAGIEVSQSENGPRLYCEHGNKAHPVFTNLGPWEFGQPATVSVTNTSGNVWTVTINGKSCGSYTIPGARTAVTGESWYAVGHENQYQISIQPTPTAVPVSTQTPATQPPAQATTPAPVEGSVHMAADVVALATNMMNTLLARPDIAKLKASWDLSKQDEWTTIRPFTPEAQAEAKLFVPISNFLTFMVDDHPAAYKLMTWGVSQLKNPVIGPTLNVSHMVDIVGQAGELINTMRQQNKLPQGFDINKMDFPALEAWLYEERQKGLTNGWESPQAVHTYPDGWTVDRVTTENDLKREGALMQHCVGGYYPAVERGSSLIYSLREPNGQPHATMEIEGQFGGVRHEMPHDPKPIPPLHPGDPQEGSSWYRDGDDSYQVEPWNIVQIQGKQNQEPIDEYKERLKQFFQHHQAQGTKFAIDNDETGIHTAKEAEEWYERKDENGNNPYGIVDAQVPYVDWSQLPDSSVQGILSARESRGSWTRYSIDDEMKLADAIAALWTRSHERDKPTADKLVEDIEEASMESYTDWEDQNYEYFANDEFDYWKENFFDPKHYPEAFDEDGDEKVDPEMVWDNERDNATEIFEEVQDKVSNERHEYSAYKYVSRFSQRLYDLLVKSHLKPEEPKEAGWHRKARVSKLSGFTLWSADIHALAEAARTKLLERPDVRALQQWDYDPSATGDARFEDVDPNINRYARLKMFLQQMPDEGFKLFPWVVRAFKQGQIWRNGQGQMAGAGYAHALDIVTNATKWIQWSNEHNKPLPDMMSKQFGFPQMEAWVYEMNATEIEGDGWQDSKPVFTFDDGWHMDLVGSADLAKEGEIMGHCVGGYTHDVDRGSLSIYSLRDPQDQPHVTIEVTGTPDLTQPAREGFRDCKVIQVQGKQDTEPISEYRAKVDEWFEYLKDLRYFVDENDPDREPEYEYEPHYDGNFDLTDPEDVLKYHETMMNHYDRASNFGDDEYGDWDGNTCTFRNPRDLRAVNGLLPIAQKFFHEIMMGERDEPEIVSFIQGLWMSIHHSDSTGTDLQGQWEGGYARPEQDWEKLTQDLEAYVRQNLTATPGALRSEPLFDPNQYNRTEPAQELQVALDLMHRMSNLDMTYQYKFRPDNEPTTNTVRWPGGGNGNGTGTDLAPFFEQKGVNSLNLPGTFASTVTTGWHTLATAAHIGGYYADKLGPEADEDYWNAEPGQWPDMPTHVFRTMSEDHYQQSLSSGVHASDERGNYIGQAAQEPDEWKPEDIVPEGTVAGRWAYPGYLANSPNSIGRIVKIRVEPEDGWEAHPDDHDGGYYRTFKPIPVDRFEAVTDPISSKTWKPVTAAGTSDTGYPQSDTQAQESFGDTNPVPHNPNAELSADRLTSPHRFYEPDDQSGNNWVYLNGKVSFGTHHHRLIYDMATKQGMPEFKAKQMANLLTVYVQPTGVDVAIGNMAQHYPQIWISTVDRNAVWDAVVSAFADKAKESKGE